MPIFLRTTQFQTKTLKGSADFKTPVTTKLKNLNLELLSRDLNSDSRTSLEKPNLNKKQYKIFYPQIQKHPMQT